MLNGLKVLVVEDNATTRQILADSLKSFGMEVVLAESAVAALARLGADNGPDHYDLALIDWTVPEMNGGETISEFRNSPGLNGAPILIMVTAYLRTEVERLAGNLKPVGFLMKPITPSPLQETIHSVLGRKQALAPQTGYNQNETAGTIDRLRGTHILLVEDNQINQELTEDLLQSMGIRVQIANNGREALELLDKNIFDGVLMDCQMPVMDGCTASRLIREQPRFQGLPILAMTANALAVDREKVIAAGMNDHIAKPVNVNEMFRTMAKWIYPSKDRSDHSSLTREAPGEIPQALSRLPGIQASAGLTIVRGNLKLYNKLLMLFLDNYRDFESDFRAAQGDDKDPQAATRAAHSLKSSAGSIGARSVQEQAKQLEYACKAGSTEVDERLAAVTSALQPVIEGLSRLSRLQQQEASQADPI